MAAGLGARRDDDVDAGLVERDSLVGRRGRPEGDDSASLNAASRRSSGTPNTKLNAAGRASRTASACASNDAKKRSGYAGAATPTSS